MDFVRSLSVLRSRAPQAVGRKGVSPCTLVLSPGAFRSIAPRRTFVRGICMYLFCNSICISILFLFLFQFYFNTLVLSPGAFRSTAKHHLLTNTMVMVKIIKIIMVIMSPCNLVLSPQCIPIHCIDRTLA